MACPDVHIILHTSRIDRCIFQSQESKDVILSMVGKQFCGFAMHAWTKSLGKSIDRRDG